MDGADAETLERYEEHAGKSDGLCDLRHKARQALARETFDGARLRRRSEPPR